MALYSALVLFFPTPIKHNSKWLQLAEGVFTHNGNSDELASSNVRNLIMKIIKIIILKNTATPKKKNSFTFQVNR